MTVLVTMMKKSMAGKPGYISEYPENVYVFDKCLKVRASEMDIKNVNKWVCFLEGTPIVLEFDVLLTRLSTGYLQAFIYNSKCEVKTTEEVGEYNTKNGSWYVSEIYAGKLVTPKELIGICQRKYLNNPDFDPSGQVQVARTNSTVSTPKKTTEKKGKFKEDLQNMDKEKKLDLMRRIFGDSYTE